MKTLIFALLFFFSAIFAIFSFFNIDLIGIVFWTLVAIVLHKIAWGK